MIHKISYMSSRESSEWTPMEWSNHKIVNNGHKRIHILLIVFDLKKEEEKEEEEQEEEEMMFSIKKK